MAATYAGRLTTHLSPHGSPGQPLKRRDTLDHMKLAQRRIRRILLIAFSVIAIPALLHSRWNIFAAALLVVVGLSWVFESRNSSSNRRSTLRV